MSRFAEDPALRQPVDIIWVCIRLASMALVVLAAVRTFAWPEIDTEVWIGAAVGGILASTACIVDWHRFGRLQAAVTGGAMLLMTWWLAMELAASEFDLDTEPWFADGFGRTELALMIFQHQELWFRPKFVFGVTSAMLLFTAQVGIWRLPRPGSPPPT